MNRKNKNKNKQNKAPNPKPPQKAEENVGEKTEITEKNEERVPEILNVVPVEVKNETDIEVPKKPKRNRGKKKTQDDIPSEKAEDVSTVTVSPTEDTLEPKVEPAKVVEEPVIEDKPTEVSEAMMPSSRKKKNKNKKNVEKGVEIVKSDKEIASSELPAKDDIIESIVETKEQYAKDETEQVNPQSKKKKNKKNKKGKMESDNEASGDIAIEDASANIIQAIEDTDSVRPQIETASEATVEDKNKMKELETIEITKTCDIIDVKPSEQDTKIVEEPSTELKEENKCTQSKNKKKNKKKQTDSEQSGDGTEIIPHGDIVTDIAMVESTMSIANKEVKEINVIDKIKSSQSNKLTEPTPIVTSEVKCEEIILKQESNIEEKPKQEIKASPVDNIQPFETKTSESKIIENPEHLLEKTPNLPMIKDKGKKCKQSQPAKIDSVDEKIKFTMEKKETNVGISEEKTVKLVEIKGVEDKINVEIVPQETIPNVELIKDKKCTENLLEKVDTCTEMPKEDTSKSKKKNKKDKKQSHISDNIAPISEEIERFDLMEASQELKLEDNKDKASEKKEKPKLDLPKLDSKSQSLLSIQTAKIEDSDAGEFTPDSIEYPRSISQQNILDPNNNTEIKELLPETQNLNVPDTPFIKGVSEPEVIDSEIKVEVNKPIDIDDIVLPTCTRKTMKELHKPIPLPFLPKKMEIKNEAKPIAEPIGEKTDLKSKVMEVNQDMEELRLSIEKSLAELTALEKCEEMPELISVPSTETKTIETKSTEPILSETKTLLKEDSVIEKPQAEGMISLKALLNIGKQETKAQDQDPLVSPKNEPLMDLLPSESKADIQMKEQKKEKVKFEPKLQSQLEEIKPLLLPDFSKIIPTPEEKMPETGQSEKIKDGCHTDAQSCPIKKDKGKGKSKKKGKTDEQRPVTTTAQTDTTASTSAGESTTAEKDKAESKEQKKEESKEQKQKDDLEENKQIEEKDKKEFEPIDKFEDALTSSVDDVNKTFELIAGDVSDKSDKDEEQKEKIDEKQNPLVTHPKNLLGQPDIPAPSNKTDYKKEKNRIPNNMKAKVRIKDAPKIESRTKMSKESQTELPKVIITKARNDINESSDYIYKYSFRNVFLPHGCHVCKKELAETRVACNYCNLLFYCCVRHKDEDWPQHQALCFAISTIVHLKGEKHIYADAKGVTGLNYRLLRMQMIVSCEKILKRRLVPWEQEVLLYPRICADASCREWRQSDLKDCAGCGQVSYCIENLNHLPKSHNRWCKSYSLYQKLVLYQQTKGRLEPVLPTKVIHNIDYKLPDKINELLAYLYEEKIDMDELQYATLTQLATAPLTAAYSHQIYKNRLNSTFANGFIKKSTFTIHVVGAELQFEADSLNKWEIFFLHLKPEIKELKVSLIGPELNPSKLPLDLLANIRLCENCRQNKRKVLFNFYDKLWYYEFASRDQFSIPDIVCAFNPSLNRSIGINGKDSWQSSINAILKLRSPLCVTSYTPAELPKDLTKIQQYAAMDIEVLKEPSYNPYASIRPDRNFISDDEQPLLFKNFSFMIVAGVF